ncbi:protein phosphatase 2C domain-containing protein [Streptomyces beihaiensis]|uniref:Protein phosphatase 2C domain-containing protein n=1 Tax=Streptomyces beihaiensis TaxID=2984495 RepID=A0ABT3TWT3_9ACTN|nr:protein phosphatase 2C domain-containing protein [Streptomyces beihaiensis]MCX3061502.1 protein phosphatase 2C domain-containing protein [Streptomyces beihaiensis]
MSQMHDEAAKPVCPSCEEPLEEGDRFCGACGYDLSSVVAAPGGTADDHPTLAVGTEPAPGPPGTPDAPGAPGTPGTPSASAASAQWPAAREPDSADTPAPVHLPTDLRGLDSSDVEAAGEPGGDGGVPGPATVRFDEPVPGGQPADGTTADRDASDVDGPGADASDADRPGADASDADRPGAIGSEADGSGAIGSDADGSGANGPRANESGANGPGANESDTDGPGTNGPGANESDTDGPDTDGDFTLAAPDPRTATAEELGAATPPSGTKVCVACRAGQVDPDGYCENCGHAQPRERDHMEQELGAVAAVSDRGLRHHRNEDAFAVSSAALPDATPAVVAVVCDGVSSATRPDEASLTAARAADESLHESLPRGTHPQQAMHEAIVAAAEAVNALAREPEPTASGRRANENSPACTIVASVVTRELLVVGWVGDSRAYWVPDDRGAPAARLTEDDSWAAQMVAAGLMNEEQAYADERAHAITGWLGADAYELEPHTASFKPDRAGTVVICTDGLWNYAESAEQMARIVPTDAAGRPLHAAQVLVGHALDGGGHDNVTVAVLPFPVTPRGAGSA